MSRRRNRTNRAGAAVGLNYYRQQAQKKCAYGAATPSGTQDIKHISSLPQDFQKVNVVIAVADAMVELYQKEKAVHDICNEIGLSICAVYFTGIQVLIETLLEFSKALNLEVMEIEFDDIRKYPGILYKDVCFYSFVDTGAKQR